MIDPQTRQAICRLHQAGMGLREISRRLKVSRGTIRTIIVQRGVMPSSSRADKIEIEPNLLRRLFAECDGYVQRVYEKLLEEEREWMPAPTEDDEEPQKKLGYSTLTRMLRELGLGNSREERCDRVADEPGAEMQHDTTVYQVRLGDRVTKLIASIVYLRYSKRRYLKLYRSFNRFHMKCFLHEALVFWGYCAPRCIIDNTNLARLRGSGKNAVIVPEMEAFSKRYGFHFQCHEIGHANRKAGNERSFFTVETNFLPGRRFQTLEDLNQRALEWATVRMEHRPVGKSKLIPTKAFEHERVYLSKLPPYLPAPYLLLARTIDQYGYVPLDGNFYWVPGEGRGEVKVLKYSDRLEVYQRRELLAEYRLAADGVKNQCFSPPGYPKPRHEPKNRKKRTAEEEKKLRAMDEVIGPYLDFALKSKGPQQRHRFVRELFRLAQQMTTERLCRAVGRAMKYGITSAETVRDIVVLQLKEDAEPLPVVEVDESFQKREAYLEGYLSEAPDFSPYDDLLEEDEDDG